MELSDELNPVADGSSSGSSNERGKYLTFKLANETYGIEISYVQEIIRRTQITPVPHTPEYIDGIVNLRGRIFPVLNLYNRFGVSERRNSDMSCMIFAHTSNSPPDRIVAISVDEVSDVVHIPREQIEDSPALGRGSNVNMVSAIGHICQDVVLILDTEQLLPRNEGSSLKEVGQR
jgi:purine-binding chemotaxis protein CheW